ncbi:MAG: hypothetical protein U9Q98_04575, partial [Bacteroidota bacterium]|nr:hypothetical protein [Bacteroidota bacterium]
MYCADTWIQATDATSDYFNCGYNFDAATNAGIFAYDGSAYVGAIFSPGWQEYVGSCLPTPLTAGIQYTIEMNIASTPMDDYGNVCNGGTIDYGPIDITIFGHANCSQLPYSTEVCPGGGWYVLATQTYTPVSSWGTISLSFIPSANVGAVMIGSPCTLPSGYSGACFPYFYFDNLILNETEAFNLVSVTQSGNLCSDDLMLTASSSGSGTYQWYYEGVAITGQTGTTLDVSSAGYGAGTYQVMFTDDDGTPGIVGCSIAEIVVVQDIVNITIDNTQDISCYGVADGSISITPSGGTEPYTYSWIGPGGYTSTDEDISELSAGTYNVTVTDVNECTAEDDMQLTANPNPTASITPDPAEMCPGETLTMDGNPSGGSGVWSTHLWTGDTGPLSATNVQNPDFSTTSAGTYNLTYTITDDNGCTGTDAVSVTVNPAPPVDLGADQTHCDYDVPVTIDAGLGMTSYEWSNDETTQTIEVTESGTYIVTVTNDQSCTASDEIEVTVNPSPEPDLGEDIIECEYNTPVILDAGSGASFLWSNGGTTSTINVSNSDNYIVTVTDTYGCTGEDDINLVVNPDLEPDAGEDIVVCSYDYVMDGSSTDSGTEGTWEQLSGPVAASIANENDPNTTVSVNMYGVYEFIWRVEYLDGSGCWGSDTVTVEFYTIIGTIYAENPLCHNSSDGMAWVIVNGGVPPYSYLWTDGQDTDTATNLSAGWQNVTITDANDCQISKEIYLTPPNEIIVSGLGNRQICIGGTANINIAVTGGTPPYSYFWQGSNGDTWYGSQLSVSP